jgi:hypothetical protein
MLLLKTRSVSHELRVLRSLNTRMILSGKEKQHYLNLEKGYQGEVMFDKLTEKLQSDVIVLNDLCLEFNNSTFQIDTLIISQDTINPFEVKNFEGDFSYESGSFQTISKKEIMNPLDQLNRSKSLLRQLLQSMGVHLSIEGYVIFINPEFTLYQAPLNAPLIFPTQLNHLIKEINQSPSKLNAHHQKLADQLISMHKIVSPYTKFPPYKYENLKKGTICSIGNSFMTLSASGKKLECNKCEHREDVKFAVLRSVEELKLLFPDKRITTNCIYEWCKVLPSKKQISRILKENFKMMGSGQWTYYE